MTSDERREIEGLAWTWAKTAGPPCEFVLHGYGDPRPCMRSAHPKEQVHDCQGILVAAA